MTAINFQFLTSQLLSPIRILIPSFVVAQIILVITSLISQFLNLYFLLRLLGLLFIFVKIGVAFFDVILIVEF